MKKDNYFWVGYADLMTGLFFIMLVLFVVSINGFKIKEIGFNRKVLEADSLKLVLENQLLEIKKNKKVLESEKKKLEEMQNAIKALPSKYFEYQEPYKRFSLKMQVNFDVGSSVIDTSKYQKDLSIIGMELKKAIDNLSAKYSDYDIRYLLVIEGMSSTDDYYRNYELSYERALSLYRLWIAKGIEFDPNICEIQIAGSGTGGIGRYKGINEILNQRFLIQIVPKIGKI